MHKYLTHTLLLLFALTSSNALAEVSPANSGIKDKEAIISISFENDIFSDEDNNYTNGARVSYLSAETVAPWLENLGDKLPFSTPGGNKRWGFEVGQSIFTPDNIAAYEPDPNDQPYAGWLYGTGILLSDNDTSLDTYGLTLGMIGSASGAHETQDFVHRAINYQRPNGWERQLKDEPGVVLSYDHKWRNVFQASPFGLGFDITPSWGANLGNVDTSGNVGIFARLGRDLPSDYGPPLIRPSVSGSQFFIPTKKFGWYVFGGFEGRVVARNIFLDGNTFRDSPSVDKEILVGGTQAGVAITFNDVRISYTQVVRTKQYETQEKNDNYGAVNVSWRF